MTPSRAAIVASLDSADTDPETFIRQLGIERVQALVHGEPWTLDGALRARVRRDASGVEVLPVDAVVLRALQKEDDRRADNRELIAQMIEKDATLAADPVLVRWSEESKPLPQPWPTEEELLPVRRVMGDPAHVNERIAFARSEAVKARWPEIKWASEDLYGYSRAFSKIHLVIPTGLTVLDPTAGGGSIPFEALRLGHTVIANELNPVATVILHATLDYPARFGADLVKDISWDGARSFCTYVEHGMEGLSPFSPIARGGAGAPCARP